MLPYATPPISAELDPYEERERDILRTPARQQLGFPGPGWGSDCAGHLRG